MFSNLFSFGLKRNVSQSIGFYIAHFLLSAALVILLAVVLGIFMAMIGMMDIEADGSGRDFGYMVSSIATPIIFMGYAALIISKKNIWNFPNVLFFIATGVISVVTFPVLGLILPAYLTTLENKSQMVNLSSS
jgi:hypothetical protein